MAAPVLTGALTGGVLEATVVPEVVVPDAGVVVVPDVAVVLEVVPDEGVVPEFAATFCVPVPVLVPLEAAAVPRMPGAVVTSGVRSITPTFGETKLGD